MVKCIPRLCAFSAAMRGFYSKAHVSAWPWPGLMIPDLLPFSLLFGISAFPSLALHFSELFCIGAPQSFLYFHT
jgi:hypothetical protein